MTKLCQIKYTFAIGYMKKMKIKSETKFVRLCGQKPHPCQFVDEQIDKIFLLIQI